VRHSVFRTQVSCKSPSYSDQVGYWCRSGKQANGDVAKLHLPPQRIFKLFVSGRQTALGKAMFHVPIN
jgi:hypothetical protein